MPQATLSFTLPDDESDLRDAMQGRDAKLLLWELDQKCRALLKHGSPSQETADFAQSIRDMIHEDSRVTID